jgi:choline dehydrogenase-like flavoprotein
MSGFIRSGADISADVEETCDVCIVGSGAGGAVLAAGLVEAGLDVVMLEAGGAFTHDDFDLHEQSAYPGMYQDRGTRATADVAISILQGRTVGGSTTVNWTTCYRTPERILAHWQRVHGVEGLDPESLRPHFEAVESRLNIHKWPEGMANANNRAILRGARALGWEADTTRRNVKGCANSGYCGMGCPVDGKQAMHVTTIPDAVAGGLRLYADTEARRVVVEGGRAVRVEATVLDRRNSREVGRRVVVKPKVLALSGGAINTPALLLRSGLDAGGKVGRRTFIHPVVGMAALFDEKIDGFYGAPQSAASHQFIERGDDKIGFFLEAAPVQPMLIALGTGGFGEAHAAFMEKLPYSAAMLALCVDGLLPGDDGGVVSLRSDGRIRVDYPIRPALQEGFRAAHRALAELALASGAKQAISMHADPVFMDSPADLGRLDAATYGAHEHGIFTAHQMGGCGMGADGVVDSEHRFRGVDNLFVVDGSVLPTALGVNPSQTIYGLAHRARAFVAGAV